jgi:hypothetical protein
MKKQASDQQFHDRRHQERKRAEAAKKSAANKPTTHEGAPPLPPEAAKDATDKRSG